MLYIQNILSLNLREHSYKYVVQSFNECSYSSNIALYLAKSFNKRALHLHLHNYIQNKLVSINQMEVGVGLADMYMPRRLSRNKRWKQVIVQFMA